LIVSLPFVSSTIWSRRTCHSPVSHFANKWPKLPLKVRCHQY